MIRACLGVLVALGLVGCAPKQELAPQTTQETKSSTASSTPMMYLEDRPTKELAVVEEETRFSLRPLPELTRRELIVQNAMNYLGKRDGGDCSGFVSLINAESGFPFYHNDELSRYYDNARKSRAMFNMMSKQGNAFETSLPNIGDLVFFENTERKPAVKTKTKGKKVVKTPAVQVAENITHVGIVTHVDKDGTVEFIHHSNGKNILDYMNFNYPMLTNKDGKKINTYMKRCPSKNGAAQPQCMNLAFFVAYGTF